MMLNIKGRELLYMEAINWRDYQESFSH